MWLGHLERTDKGNNVKTIYVTDQKAKDRKRWLENMENRVIGVRR